MTIHNRTVMMIYIFALLFTWIWNAVFLEMGVWLAEVGKIQQRWTYYANWTIYLIYISISIVQRRFRSNLFFSFVDWSLRLQSTRYLSRECTRKYQPHHPSHQQQQTTIGMIFCSFIFVFVSAILSQNFISEYFSECCIFVASAASNDDSWVSRFSFFCFISKLLHFSLCVLWFAIGKQKQVENESEIFQFIVH